MDWNLITEWASLIGSVIFIIGSFYVTTKWMFDKLNKNTTELTKKVEEMRSHLDKDMQEIREDARLATLRIDEANKRIDETNRRIDATLERIDRQYDITIAILKEKRA